MKIIFAIAMMASLSAWADHIPLDRLKTVKGLSFETRMLVAKLANFEINKDEAKVLAAKPDAADAIIELSELVEDFDHLADVYGVLRLSSHLTDFQQKRIRDALNPLVGNMNGGRVAVLKQQGLYLIANHPSTDNEALLIRFLSERKHWRDSDYSDVAAEGLSRIGTPKALQALREYAARAKPPEGYQSRGYDAAIEAEKVILARTASGAKVTPSKSSAINGTASKTPEAKPPSATPSEEPTSSTPWSIIVVLIVAAGGLLWLLLKRRS